MEQEEHPIDRDSKGRPVILSHERRQHERYGTDAEVLVVPREGGREPFWAKATNVSYGGMFLLSEEILPAFFEFEARVFPAGSQPFRVRARVVHAGANGMGCCFSLTAQSTLHLEHWLGRSGGLTLAVGTIESRSGKSGK